MTMTGERPVSTADAGIAAEPPREPWAWLHDRWSVTSVSQRRSGLLLFILIMAGTARRTLARLLRDRCRWSAAIASGK